MGLVLHNILSPPPQFSPILITIGHFRPNLTFTFFGLLCTGSLVRSFFTLKAPQPAISSSAAPLCAMPNVEWCAGTVVGYKGQLSHRRFHFTDTLVIVARAFIVRNQGQPQ